jgi:hypothetical protein
MRLYLICATSDTQRIFQEEIHHFTQPEFIKFQEDKYHNIVALLVIVMSFRGDTKRQEKLSRLIPFI